MAHVRARRARKRVTPQEGGRGIALSRTLRGSAGAIGRAVVTAAIFAACVDYETPADPVSDPLVGPPPATPLGVAVEPGPYTGAITVNWPFVLDAQTYNVYWGTSANVTKESAFRIAGIVPPYVHPDRTPGTTYYYMVAGVGAGGEGIPTTIMSGVAKQSVGVHVESPGPGALIDENVPIILNISANTPPSSLVATIGSKNAPITYDATISRWTGTVSMASVASPAPQLLTVRATGAQGEIAQALVTVRLDRKPILAVTSPADQTPLTAATRVTATCSDDAQFGCLLLTAYVEGSADSPIASGMASIDLAMLPALQRYTTGTVRIVIEARDTAGQTQKVFRTLIIP